jgi:hypothetical protein
MAGGQEGTHMAARSGGIHDMSGGQGGTHMSGRAGLVGQMGPNISEYVGLGGTHKHVGQGGPTWQAAG